jgi:hypothetical protein
MSENQPQQIPPDQPVTVTITMPAARWNALLRYLDEGPHRIVRPVIGEILRQGSAQVPPPGAPTPARSGNGAAEQQEAH